MPIILNQPDGLHILAQAVLKQLLEDETLTQFADGLLPAAFAHPPDLSLTLAEALHYPGEEVYPLLTALLALDAEIRATVGDKQRVLALSGFLSYRSSLPPDKVSLDSMRLPPLNSGGHYRFVTLDEGACLVIRMDVHPRLKVTGHVRLVVSSPARPPIRLLAAEQRLNRQVLTETLIEIAVVAGSQALPVPLRQMEQVGLVRTLKELIGGG
jgi:hypothetical protein